MPYRMTDVVSPVRITENAPKLGDLSWLAVGGDLLVSWGEGKPQPNVLGRTDRQGYLVTKADDPAFPPGPTVARVTVSGHPAVIMTTPNQISRTQPYQFSALLWVSWPLGDGRRIHVWQQDDNDDALVAFAQSFREEPTPLTRVFSIGLTLPGLTQQVSFSTPYPGFVGSIGMQLCPAAPALTLAAINVSSVDPTPCLAAQTLLGEPFQVEKMANFTRNELALIKVDGRSIFYGPRHAYHQPPPTAITVVDSPVPLSSTDTAALLAAARHDPALG